MSVPAFGPFWPHLVTHGSTVAPKNTLGGALSGRQWRKRCRTARHNLSFPPLGCVLGGNPAPTCTLSRPTDQARRRSGRNYTPLSHGLLGFHLPGPLPLAPFWRRLDLNLVPPWPCLSQAWARNWEFPVWRVQDLCHPIPNCADWGSTYPSGCPIWPQ